MVFTHLLKKYECNSIKDIKGNVEIINIIDTIVFEKKIQHNFILVGPSGVGKKSVLKCIIKSKYCINNSNLLWIQGSTDRSIQLLREKISNFVTKKTISPEQPKILIFEEADSLSDGVMQLCRSIIQKHTSDNLICVFICSSNDNMIESLQSRCVIFNFKQIDTIDIFNHLKYIAKQEKIEIEDDALYTLAVISDGDIRASILHLEFLQIYNKQQNYQLTSEKILEICLFPCYSVIKEILQNIIKKNIKNCIQLTKKLTLSGFSGIDIIFFIKKYIFIFKNKKEDEIMTEIHNPVIFSIFNNEISKTLIALKDNVDPYIQLNSMCCRIIQQI